MSPPAITILSVNWYSTDYLVRLLDNLYQKAADPAHLQALIIDNTNGRDADLSRIRQAGLPCRVLPFDSQNLTSSRAHAAALDFAMPHLETEYCLIIDPDVHVFKKGWDRFCLSELNDTEAVAIGAPYPGWKLGKYHDFPSPIFCFFRTDVIRHIPAPWTPFGHSSVHNFCIFLVRQAARLGGLITRTNYQRHRILRAYGHWIEKAFGTFSQDTGWRIARAARQQNLKRVVFEVADSTDRHRVPAAGQSAFSELAAEYELYHDRDAVILTHKYGTGVYLWKTQRGPDTSYWLAQIEQLEAVLNPMEPAE